MHKSYCNHRAFPKALAIAAAACCLAGAVTVQAQWSENFDSYASGSQVAGQGGWQGWDDAAAAGALVSSAQSLSSPNSIAIAGGSDLVQKIFRLYLGAVGLHGLAIHTHLAHHRLKLFHFAE